MELTGKSIATVLTALALLGSGIWCFASISEKAGQYTRQIDLNRESITEIKQDIKDISAKTNQIGTDIEWIKDTLKRKL